MILSPPLQNCPPDLLVIAGEHSGDAHGAHILQGFSSCQPQKHIYALGGPALKQGGAEMLLDMMPYSVVGFWEVLRHYSFFRSLLRETVDWIKKYKPKGVLLVDYPGFNLLLAKALFQEGLSKAAGGPTAVLYYIAPQIWAWKAKRRFAMAQYVDALATIFPFEKKYFEDTTLPVTFVGHPFTNAHYTPPLHYAPNKTVLLLPGSREAAVRRIFPTLLQTMCFLSQSGLLATVLYPNERIRNLTQALYEKLKKPLPITFERVGERTVEAAAVLMSSGTISLHCALAGIPGAIVYRAHPLTYFLGKRLVKVPYLGIANLLLQRTVYPEYIQGVAEPQKLSLAIQETINSAEPRKNLQTAATELQNILKPSGISAPEWLQNHLNAAQKK